MIQTEDDCEQAFRRFARSVRLAQRRAEDPSRPQGALVGLREASVIVSLLGSLSEATIILREQLHDLTGMYDTEIDEVVERALAALKGWGAEYR